MNVSDRSAGVTNSAGDIDSNGDVVDELLGRLRAAIAPESTIDVGEHELCVAAAVTRAVEARRRFFAGTAPR